MEVEDKDSRADLILDPGCRSQWTQTRGSGEAASDEEDASHTRLEAGFKSAPMHEADHQPTRVGSLLSSSFHSPLLLGLLGSFAI